MSCHGKAEEEGKQSRNPLQQNRAGYTAGQQMEQKSLFRKNTFYVQKPHTLK